MNNTDIRYSMLCVIHKVSQDQAVCSSAALTMFFFFFQEKAQVKRLNWS